MIKRDGWIFIDKPVGLTSNTLLQQVRNNLDRVKAGFVGTLDPLASGYLPIALGSATKVIPWLKRSVKDIYSLLIGGKKQLLAI